MTDIDYQTQFVTDDPATSSSQLNNCVSRENACSLRTRPPEWVGVELLHITVEITLAASSTYNCDHFDCAI